MKGELRSALTNLDESREKHKNVVEKISYWRSILDKGNFIDDFETKLNEKTKECSRLEEEVIKIKKELKDTKDQIDNGMKLKGGSEVLDVMLSSQK